MEPVATVYDDIAAQVTAIKQRFIELKNIVQQGNSVTLADLEGLERQFLAMQANIDLLPKVSNQVIRMDIADLFVAINNLRPTSVREEDLVGLARKVKEIDEALWKLEPKRPEAVKEVSVVKK